MVLEIYHEDHCYKIKGSLDRDNLSIFQKTFNNIFDKEDEVVLCIENLEAIDRDGVRAIAKLHNESLRLQKKLSIIGLDENILVNNSKDHDAA